MSGIVSVQQLTLRAEGHVPDVPDWFLRQLYFSSSDATWWKILPFASSTYNGIISLVYIFFVVVRTNWSDLE